MSGLDSFETELQSALGDGYVLERELTGSGMSRVFVALEKSLNRQVVVKVLPPELAAGVNRERFRREIQLAAQLQHPHIVPLHAAGSAADLLYFTMPYIEGESLRYALHENVKFSPREVVRILHDVSDALAYAHSRGVIHRDIKPGNVLRSGSHAVVTDFGVAKAISAALPSVGMTTSGMAIGTPAYMAPEQLAGDPAADHRVDIYAVGLLGYELLAGEAPFKASSPQETMAAQLTRAPEPISKRRPDAPPALAALLTRCLAKNPADRPQTATEIVSLLDSLEISSGAMTPLRAFTPRRVWILGGLVTAAAVSAIALWPRQDVQPTSVVADSTPAAATAPALTREDSLAIAAAIQQKLGEQQTTVTAKAESAVTKPVQSGGGERAVASAAEDLSRSVTRMVDSLRAEIQKAVLDSVTRVRGAPQALTFNMGDPKIDSIVRRFQRENERRGTGRPDVIIQEHKGEQERRSEQQLLRAQQLSREAFAARMETLGPPRRVFVSYPTLNSRSKFLAPQVDSVVDSLRRTLARDPRYVLIPEDSVRAMLARTRTISAISDSMNVELFASVGASVLPDTSVIWQVTSRDLTAHSAYMTRAVTMHGFKPDVLSGMDSLVTSIARFLKEQDRAPRRSLLGQNR
ncbi:MAG TPA: serine/threonine-protein kinase [Gemmatimonadaceae bacterium]|nr:serine/threonine-protein kinase [Gemmatimonadaceae bacterium]